MYLFTTTRHGVPAKEIQRQISVTYKTAWRMADQIRQYMGQVDGDAPLSGTVEIDETYIGGSSNNTHDGHIPAKTIVFGMVQRGGEVMTKVVPNCQTKTLLPIVTENVQKKTHLMSDSASSLDMVGRQGYVHRTVDHRAKEYVRDNVHTNSIEGFWSQLKRSIKGTHVHVSKKHMSKYLGEFEFRYNRRKNPTSMFDSLLKAF